jgi:RNA polymerase sigma factor (sigma-70 family)
VTAGVERDALILSLHSMVRRIALARRASLPRFLRGDDLLSAAWLGAVEAVDRFDPARGTDLQTYASWRIRGAIGDYLRSLDPVSRDERRKLRGDPNAQPPRTFSITALPDQAPFDVSDPKSLLPFRAIEARVHLAAILRASHGVKPRALRIVRSHAAGELMKDIGRSEGIEESRVSQICKRTCTELRRAA